MSYAPGSPERNEAKNEYQKMISKVVELPMIINGKKIKTKSIKNIYPPHDHKRVVGKCHYGNESHVKSAIESASKAKKTWSEMPLGSNAVLYF